MFSARYTERNVSPSPSGPPKKRPKREYIKRTYSQNFAPAMMTAPAMATAPALTSASASASASGTAPALTTNANATRIDLTDISDSPHTPPNAPRKARDDDHLASFTVAQQALIGDIYKEFRQSFKKKGLPKTVPAILKYAQERLADQKQLLAEQKKLLTRPVQVIRDRDQEIQHLNAIITRLSRTVARLNAALEARDGQIMTQERFIKAQDKIIPEQEYEIKELGTIVKEEKAHIIEQGKRNGYLEGLLMEHGCTKEWMEGALERMEKGESAKDALEAVDNAA
jgi:hypothetical protein